jgi:flagellin
MSLGVLNNISAIYAQNNLNQTQNSLQTVLQQLSSGSRINSGADDAAGQAISNGLAANVAALTQSSRNATDGVSLLQTADGALAQVNSLLNRAITLATQAANSTLNPSQVDSANQEFQNILTEIGNIGTNTTFNGNQVFTDNVTSIFVSDGTAQGSTTFTDTIGALTTASIGTTTGAGPGEDLSTADLSTGTPSTILTQLTAAIQDVAFQRGTIGANINQLNAAANVASTETVNLTSAQNNIQAVDFGTATSDLAKFQVLSQTGIAALAQANSTQQEILKLLQ